MRRRQFCLLRHQGSQPKLRYKVRSGQINVLKWFMAWGAISTKMKKDRPNFFFFVNYLWHRLYHGTANCWGKLELRRKTQKQGDDPFNYTDPAFPFFSSWSISCTNQICRYEFKRRNPGLHLPDPSIHTNDLPTGSSYCSAPSYWLHSRKFRIPNAHFEQAQNGHSRSQGPLQRGSRMYTNQYRDEVVVAETQCLTSFGIVDHCSRRFEVPHQFVWRPSNSPRPRWWQIHQAYFPSHYGEDFLSYCPPSTNSHPHQPTTWSLL